MSDEEDINEFRKYLADCGVPEPWLRWMVDKYKKDKPPDWGIKKTTG